MSQIQSTVGLVPSICTNWRTAEETYLRLQNSEITPTETNFSSLLWTHLRSLPTFSQFNIFFASFFRQNVPARFSASQLRFLWVCYICWRFSLTDPSRLSETTLLSSHQSPEHKYFSVTLYICMMLLYTKSHFPLIFEGD